MMWAALIVAFIAGYAIVSFAARKVKDARDRHPGPPPPQDDKSDWS